MVLIDGDGKESVTKIPVILDTDIGTDIDDTWELAIQGGVRRGLAPGWHVGRSNRLSVGMLKRLRV